MKLLHIFCLPIIFTFLACSTPPTATPPPTMTPLPPRGLTIISTSQVGNILDPEFFESATNYRLELTAGIIPETWYALISTRARYEIQIETMEVEVERCEFNLGYVLVRAALIARVKIVDRQDLTELHHRTFRGNEPRECGFSEEFTTLVEEVYGSLPASNAIEEWVVENMTDLPDLETLE